MRSSAARIGLPVALLALVGATASSASAVQPSGVVVSAMPDEVEVLAAACGTQEIEVTIANPWPVSRYVDVFIEPEPPVKTSRELVSTYLPAGGQVVAPVLVRAEEDAEGGTYEIDLRVGRSGAVREEVAVTVVPRPTGPGANLALGGPVEASSTHGNFSACGAVDGNADNADWDVTTGWNDGTREVFPDWLAVHFTAPQQVGRVVLTTRDIELRSLRDWDVQVRTEDSAWTTVAEVRGNTAVTVTSVFDPVTADSVRILALASNDATYSRIVELEIYAE